MAKNKVMIIDDDKEFLEELVAMSAFFKDDYSKLMKVYGIKKCLRKPFNPLDVISEIEAALAKK